MAPTAERLLAAVEAHLPRGYEIVNRADALREIARPDGVILIQPIRSRLAIVCSLFRVFRRERRQKRAA